MSQPSILNLIKDLAREHGFSGARLLAPYGVEPRSQEIARRYPVRAPSLLVVALPFGSGPKDSAKVQGHYALPPARGDEGLSIAPFAQRNYYAEAVARLQDLAKKLRGLCGGPRSSYRVLCNSPIPEKPLAAACGLGSVGRNSLLITREAGSLVILAALSLPLELEGDSPLEGGPWSLCGSCRACVEACPTGALDGEGRLDTELCIQAWASRPEEPPEEVAARWGHRLYGCTICSDACPHNRRALAEGRAEAASTARGPLPGLVDPEGLLALNDQEIQDRVRGTALGMDWLGPRTLKKNARVALRARSPNSGLRYP